MIDRVPEPGSQAAPGCRCGADMELKRIETGRNDTKLKIFRCPRCQDELRLMIWSEESVDGYM